MKAMRHATRPFRYAANYLLYNLHVLPDRRSVPRNEPGLKNHVNWGLQAGALCVLTAGGIPRNAQADPNQCSLSVSEMAFGTYDPFESQALQSTAWMTLNCTKKNIRIYLSPSAVSGAYLQRHMQNARTGERLEYNLYKDAARTELWGPKGSMKEHVKDLGANEQLMVYGVMPPGQNVSAGEYRDTIVVTVEP